MEKQKIFWVVLSVSVFVVIVLIVGVYLLRQKPQAAAAPSGAVNPVTGPGPQIFEYSQPQSQTGAEQKPGETQTMHFYIGEGAERPPANVPQTQGPPPETGVTGAQPAPPSAQPQPVTPAVPSVRPPAVTPRPLVTAALPRAAHPFAKTIIKPHEAHREVNFWIQAGSYKSQSAAEELITALAAKGLAGKVFSYDVHGGTYYRVRIGPYTNHGEADKFLSIVKQIQGLETSYVSEVGGLRNIN